MSLFQRNLAKFGKDVTLQNRDITPPLFGSASFGEDFTQDRVVKAIIMTPRGKTYFDGVSTDIVITHEIMIEYLESVTAETWILYKGRRIDILAVENCCEEDEILILTCNDRGEKEASKA